MYIHLKLNRSFCYLFFCRFSCAWFERCSSKKVGEKRLRRRRPVLVIGCRCAVPPLYERSRASVCVCVHYFLLLCFGIFFVGFFSNRKEKLKSASYKQTKSLENLSKNNRCLAFRCHFLLFSFVSIFFLLCCSASAAVATRSFVSHSVVVAVTVAFCCLCMRVRQHFFKCVCVCSKVYCWICFNILFLFLSHPLSVCMYLRFSSSNNNKIPKRK